MKANELMIGDWVINPVHKDARKIEGVYYDNELRCLVATDGRFPQEHFEPIPLTPEILEKNGFELTKSGDFYKLIDSNFDWSVEISNNDNRIGYVSGDGSVTKRFNYAHELQHALRLCGLNKLADNFKI